TYEDARLTDGTILDQSDRDRTQYEARLRTGYELKPGWVPFVEGIADTRVYDRRVNDAGFRRSSEGLGARAGSTFEITPLLTGEASAGYMTRDYEDERIRELRGPIADGALIWAPTPLTTVRLRGTTELGDTSVEESNGVQVSRATFEVQHDLRRNISLIGSLTLSEADYQGIRLREEGFEGSVKLDYRLTRSVALRASFTHERLKSTEPGSDYTANVYLVGLRFQP
ncbi:MAG: outer membrane beta-barrel protein, partial [Pseudomonadota bacterium]|nr:outer membrane beta-barrel protein [Pseudomonadota bacterium]